LLALAGPPEGNNGRARPGVGGCGASGLNPRSSELLLEGRELPLNSSWLLSSESPSLIISSAPDTELLSVPDSESESFFFFEILVSSSTSILRFLGFVELGISFCFCEDFLFSLSADKAGDFGDLRPALLGLLLLVVVELVQELCKLELGLAVSVSGLLTLTLSFFLPFVTVLLLRLVRILRFDGVISPSSKWKGEGVELVGGGDSMEVSSPYFLYKSRHFVQRTPPSLALCQSLELVQLHL